PSITIEITRALRSFEYPLAIVPPRRCRRSNLNLICSPKGIPCYCSDSRQAENALASNVVTARCAHLRLEWHPVEVQRVIAVRNSMQDQLVSHLHDQAWLILTYSKSPGLLSMPTLGAAIQGANLPGSQQGCMRLSMKSPSALEGSH